LVRNFLILGTIGNYTLKGGKEGII